jgi:hypothetical protein
MRELHDHILRESPMKPTTEVVVESEPAQRLHIASVQVGADRSWRGEVTVSDGEGVAFVQLERNGLEGDKDYGPQMLIVRVDELAAVLALFTTLSGHVAAPLRGENV